MSSGSATATSSSSFNPFPSNGTNGGNPLTNGVGPAVYYGSIAVALTLIIVITIGSRIIYKRRQRVFERARDREERLALERRGEAAGLPTYYESRITNLGLPHYTVTYEPPAVASSPPPPAGGTASPPAGPPGSPPPPTSPAAQENHFHFHFPQLPAALHLRPRRADDDLAPVAGPSSGAAAAHAYPPTYSAEPPKYEHSHLDSTPDHSAYQHQDASDPAVRAAVYAEPFIHPEELRRRRREAGLPDEEPAPADVADEMREAAVSPSAGVDERPKTPEAVEGHEAAERPLESPVPLPPPCAPDQKP